MPSFPATPLVRPREDGLQLRYTRDDLSRACDMKFATNAICEILATGSLIVSTQQRATLFELPTGHRSSSMATKQVSKLFGEVGVNSWG